MESSTKKGNRGYNINVLMDSEIKIKNAIGVFTVDSKGKPLRITKSGNGAVISFLKRYLGKKAVVFVVK